MPTGSPDLPPIIVRSIWLEESSSIGLHLPICGSSLIKLSLTRLHGYRVSVILRREEIGLPILSFGDQSTADLYHGRKTKQARRIPQQIHKVAVRKLDMVNAAITLTDLKSPPNNKLEELKGDLAGYHAIRINDQYRVIFKWTLEGPTEVRVGDYH